MKAEKAILSLFLVWMALAALFSPVRNAWAAHNSESDLASICYDCHTVNAVLADNNTSFINTSARTLPQMRAVNGGVSPGNYSPTGKKFGCTFCHNDVLRTIQGKPMKDAFNVFLAKPSQHPVDRAYFKDSLGNVSLDVNTGSTLYMSNWDNSWALPANQMDCVDCHDADANGGSYPNHPPSGTGSRAAGVNPFMLKNTAAMDNGHAPNSFCLQTCHGRSAPGPAGYKMGHLGWGAFDNTTGGPDNTLKEPSGNPLKTSKCVECHETHSTNGKPNLMGEQRQSIRNVDPTNCTSICHEGAIFSAKGHGKAGIGQTCGNCHDSSVSHRDSANRKRLIGGESATPASLPENLGANGRDDDYDGVVDNPGEASLTRSAESNCSASCHTEKHAHGGTIGTTTGTVSCLHCHDIHGNGIDNNIRMVRGTVMGKQTIYQSTSDFFRNDNSATRASICDNPNCHAKRLGDKSTAGTVLGDVQEHRDYNSGAGVTVGTVCTPCHEHSGTRSFVPLCNNCHAYPGMEYVGGTHVLSPVHDRHVASDNNGGYSFTCSTCHYNYLHNQSGVTDNTDWSTKFVASNVNIRFEGTWNPANGNGPRYNGVAADSAQALAAPGIGGTGVCAGLYCHGNSTTTASWPSGSNTTPSWNVASTGACGTCHKVLANDPALTFAHRKHTDNTAAGYRISCRKCHYQTSADGQTVTNRAAHLNRQSNVTFDLTDARVASGIYSGTATVGDSGTTTGRCSNLYCHSSGVRSTAPFDNGALGSPDWKQGALACNACHGAAGQTGISAGMPAYANGSPKINSHGKHLSDNIGCQRCHWSTTTTGNTITTLDNHVNGAYEVVNDNVSSHSFAYASPNCTSASCHGGHTAAPNMPAWGQTAGLPFGCDVCHAYTGGVPSMADADQFAYGSGMAKINADQWSGTTNGSGHGRPQAFAYPSGNPGAGNRFPACTSNCHSASVSHDNAVNPFRLRTYGISGIVDFSDANRDPGAQQDDNLICLDCHSATGANPTKATRIVEQNHYGGRHTDNTMGGTFCVDCHDPHGDANHYMIHDNVTQVSDGVYGRPVTQRPTTFSKTNLDGATGLNGVYDWGDYVKSTSPYTGLCQTCHASSGGAAYFNGNTFTAAHNKSGSPPARCTSCHKHNEDFSQSCNVCHGVLSDPAGEPAVGDNGVYHTDANNVIGTRGPGGDNTAHKIHVDYLNNFRGLMGSSACYVCHRGGGGQEAHPGNQTNKNYKSGTQPSAAYVQVALDNGGTGSVLNVSFGSGKPQPAYSGTPGTAASEANGWKTCSNTACHYGLSPSWAGKTQPGVGVLSVNSPTTWPSAGMVIQGTTGRILDKIRLSSDNTGFVSVSALKVRMDNAATAQDNADIAAVKFYLDADNDNVIDTPATPLGGGPAAYSAGTRSYTRSGIGLTIPRGQATYVLVVADIAATATGNRTIVTQALDNTYVTSDARSVTFTPFTSATVTVAPPAGLMVGSPDSWPTAGWLPRNSVNTVVDRIRLTAAASGPVTVTMLKVRLTDASTADNTEISVKFYEDANQDSVIDNVSAPLGGGAAVYSPAEKGFTRSGMSLSLAAGQTKDVLVALDTAAGATVGRTLALEALNPDFIASNAPSTSFATFQTNLFTIQLAKGTLSVIQGNTNPPYYGSYGILASPYLPAWYVGTGMDTIISERIRMAAAAGGMVIVDNVWVKNIGTALDNTDIAAVRFYDNPCLTLRYYDGGAFSNCTPNLLGSGAYNAADNTYRLSGINYVVSPGQTREIAVVFKAGTAYTDGQQRTFRTQVNNGYVQASYAASAPVITPFNGAVRTIGPVLRNGKFFSDIAEWPLTVTTFPGGGDNTSMWRGVSATADGSGSGYSVLTNLSTDNTSRTYAGYHEQTLSIPIPKTLYDLYPSTINGQIRYMRTRTSGNTATTAYLYVDLVSDLNAVVTTWTVPAPASDNTWYTYLFPAINTSSVVAKVRIRFSVTTPALAGAGLGMRWDEISLAYGPYGSPAFAPPRYTGDTTAIRCDACHQFGPRDYPLDGNGHPTTGQYTDQYYYASPGSHINHGVGDPQDWTGDGPTAGQGTSCAPCHGDISGYNTTDHINGVKFVNSGHIGEGGLANGTWDPGTRTCGSVNCHGNAQTPAWGAGAVSCTGCHLGPGDVDDFGTGTPVSMFSSGGSAIIARIDNTEWLYSGHGKPSGTYDSSLHPAANFGRNASPNAVSCLYCHDGNSSHRDPANPFRLANYNWQLHGWNGNCLICHSKSTPSAVGYDPDGTAAVYTSINSLPDNSTRVDTAHYASKHAAGKNGGAFCWDCHDPHGDRTNVPAVSGNIFMIGKKVTRQSDGAFGIPVGGNDNSNRVVPAFTAAATGTDYAKASPGPYTGICQVCHDGTVSHYTSTSGDAHYPTTRCTNCHTHGANFEPKCADCHDNDGAKLVPSPLVVWSRGLRPVIPNRVAQGAYGSHLVARKSDPIDSSTDWNAQCNKCHKGHGGAGTNVQIPMPPTAWNDRDTGGTNLGNMQTRLGFDNGVGSWSYAVDNGVWVGGSHTTGATEAEICWNCHDDPANNVSEWGYNTKTTPAGYPVVLNTSPGNFPTTHDGSSDRVNMGHLYTDNNYTTQTSDWTAGYWQNEYDGAMRSRIASIHSANLTDPAGRSSSVGANVLPDNTVRRTNPVLEGKQYIRCSYCHDVHDLGGAKGPPADVPNKGKPFLRGGWVGNPYPPELPPRAAGTYNNGIAYSYPTGAPRNRSYNRERGGYFIDQNSGWPTDNPAMDNLDKTSGLCTLCHGANVDTMDYYTGSKMWRTSMANGHSNSTLGGTRSNARDIFSGVRPTWDMGNQTHVGTSLYPLGANNRACVPSGYCCVITNAGWYGGVNPPLIDTCTGFDGDYANWYGTGTIGGAKGPGSMAHKFTCSKCHDPHAAGMPALLVHNCVDAVLGNGVGSMNGDAFNCHRKEPTGDSGWHRLAPGQ